MTLSVINNMPSMHMMEHKSNHAEHVQQREAFKETITTKLESMPELSGKHLETHNPGEQDYSHLAPNRHNKMHAQHMMTETRADALSQHVAMKAESRIESINERSNKLGEHFDRLEQKAINKGQSGENIAALGDKVEARLEQHVKHVEQHATRTQEIIQKRLDHSYNIQPSPVETLTEETTDIQV